MHSGRDRDYDVRQLQKRADLIARMILTSDYRLVDVQIERSKLRDEAERICPEKIDIYDRIYESRFDRLIEQFRQEGDEERWNWDEEPGDEPAW